MTLTKEEQIQRGHAAERLLNDPILDEAFTVVREALQTALVGSEPHERDKRERLYLQLKLLARVRAHLEQVAQSGALTKRQLRDLDRTEVKRGIF